MARGARLALCAALLLATGALGLAADARAEQASEPASPAAGGLDAGGFHSCALVTVGALRCWGFGADGQLGYASTNSVGDDETPASVGPVNLAGHGVKAVAAGDTHTCALLDDASVRCWGFGAQGRLGYANQSTVTNPASVGQVDLGAGRTALAISAGVAHTCALLDHGSVRCWGFGGTSADGAAFSPDGRLGYGNVDNIGDNETPGSVGPVQLGGPAMAISAGDDHTCALMVDTSVRCWGVGGSGQLGYGDRNSIGDDEPPRSVGSVQLGGPAVAISAGGAHSCALLANGSVRCWGEGGAGQLGYGNRDNIGDNEKPDTAGPVDLGGLKAVAISAGSAHTCAVLQDGSVRCWGLGATGRLGYANQDNIGDNETPASAGPVDLGGLKAVAISAGSAHTCARLEGGGVRCWGSGAAGRLGYCNQKSIGDDETPGSAGPVNLDPGDGGVLCAGSPKVAAATTSGSGAAQSTDATKFPVASSDAVRAGGLRGCLAAVSAHARVEQRLARQVSPRQRTRARRHLGRHARDGRRHCLHVFGRTPGRPTGLRARALSKTQIELSFDAPGTDGNHPPPASSYIVKQSRGPIRSVRAFSRAQTLCGSVCRFSVARVGGRLSLTVTDLKPHRTYYYAVAARDNVSARRGLRSRPVKAKTR